MTCKECDDIIYKTLNDPSERQLCYFRVDVSNMVMIGCRKHLRMALDKFNKETKE
jgi:hypothetical protein